MKNTSTFLSLLFAISALSFSAQSSLLEHIPTNEFAVVKFDGASLQSKSKELNQLAISDSISNQFNRLLKEYKQVLIDENTSVSDSEIEVIKDQLERAIEESMESPENAQEKEDEAVEEVIEDYNYNNGSYDNYYKVTPKLKLEKLFVALMSKGTDYGINNNTNYYFIVGMNDSINHNALLFNKSDATKFDAFINSIVPKSQREDLVKLNNGYEYYSDKNIMIAWNKEVVAFIDYTIPYRYDYSSYEETVEAVDEEYYESYEERLAAKAKKKEEEKR